MPSPSGKPSRNRRHLWTGLIVIAAGLLIGNEALDSFKTGKPIYTLRHVAMEWWEELGLAVGTVSLGLCLIAVGLGWMKLRGERPQ